MLIDEEKTKKAYLDTQKPNLTSYQRTKYFKQVHDLCKKTRTCPHCGAYNGVVKKMPKFPLKIVHDKYK